MTPATDFPITSTSTQGELGRGASQFSSAATTALPEVVGPPLDVFIRRQSRLRSLVIATMMPALAVDDVLFRRKLQPGTASGYVLFLGEEIDWATEEPSFVAVQPRRRTFRFRSQGPSRRLSRRLPFIAVSGPEEEE